MTDETDARAALTRATELRWLSEKVRGRLDDATCDMLDQAASDIDLLVDALMFAVRDGGGVKWTHQRKMSGVYVHGVAVADEAPERIRPLLLAAAMIADDEVARDD